MATAIPLPSSSESASGKEPKVPVPPPAPPAIELAGIHKRFRKFTVRRGYTTLKSSLVNRLFRQKFPVGNYLDVLNGIDLDVARGTTLGLIGRNGSGKSTLLKVMAGIIRPDSGTVAVRGRISPLIELGAGFHPDFSGRENVYLNGLVIGMSRAETERRFDEIVDFAGLADAIDDPVRTYSSGMYMRLAFSVAVHADPEVLLIDEILAVGDESFIGRCYERLSSFQEAGKTIVMVSHSLESIERWCHEAVWIERGQIAARGHPRSVTERYHLASAASAPTAEPQQGSELRDSLSPGKLTARMRVVEAPSRTSETWHYAVRALLEVENTGDTVWRSLPPTRRGTVMVGGRIYEGDRIIGEMLRALIPRDVYPKERATVELKWKLPKPGRYRLEIDMVDEAICWFSEQGSEVLALEVSV
jgi:ABC-type polysaccharide/polyol phosphate transport system ATPase subunit